jgi:acyl carrier protein
MTDDNLIKLVSKSLKAKVNLNSDSNNTPEWDSIGHLSIISALDKLSKGKTEKIDLSECYSVKKLSTKLKKIKI